MNIVSTKKVLFKNLFVRILIYKTLASLRPAGPRWIVGTQPLLTGTLLTVSHLASLLRRSARFW